MLLRMCGSVLFRLRKRFVRRTFLLFLTAALLGAGVATAMTAFPVSLAWEASPDDRVTGYAVYYGVENSGVTNRIDVGPSQSVTLYDLAASANYFFFVVSYIDTGLESDPSN